MRCEHLVVHGFDNTVEFRFVTGFRSQFGKCLCHKIRSADSRI